MPDIEQAIIALREIMNLERQFYWPEYSKDETASMIFSEARKALDALES